MRNVTKKVYTFNELSEEIQEKVINAYRDNSYNFDFNDFHGQFIIDYWIEKLQDIGFEDAQIEYTGFYSQGDGASFTASVNIEKLINTFTMDNIITKGQAILYNKFLGLRDINIIEMLYYIEKSSSRYSHEQTMYITNESEFYLNENNTAYDYFNSKFEELAEEIIEFARSIAQDIYFELRQEYEYINSEEYIKNELIERELEFYEDGCIYDE
jgi:hypothetical protein